MVKCNLIAGLEKRYLILFQLNTNSKSICLFIQFKLKFSSVFFDYPEKKTFNENVQINTNKSMCNIFYGEKGMPFPNYECVCMKETVLIVV